MYCDNCGMPRGVGKANVWKPNGVIVSKYENDLRGVFVDAAELNNLFTALSERIGYDVSRLVIEGKRKDSEYYTRTLLKGIRESGSEPPGPEEFLRIMAANYSVPGFGKVTILDYRDGESVVLEMERVYSVPMAQGQAAGVFEGVVNRRGDVSWEGDAVYGRVTITSRNGGQLLEQRVESVVEMSESLVEIGDREYSLCPRCSIPQEFSSEFDWDVDEALITENRSGHRYVFDNNRGIAAVMQLLIEELGEEIERIIVEISREYARGYYRALSEKITLDSELSRFSLLGWGFLSPPEKIDGGYTIGVANPFYGPVVAGRAWGLMETLDGGDYNLGDISLEDGVVRMELNQA
jgi:hypothetical protein